MILKYTLVQGSPQKKNRKIYDNLLKGGWVANSKHDFFSIKNYDIIKGGWVTDFHVIIFKLSFFHKSPYDFPFFNTFLKKLRKETWT